MFLDELKNATNRTIGTKQTTKAVKNSSAKAVYIADEAEKHVTEPLIELCNEKNIPVNRVDTMIEIGQACNIDIGAASAAIIEY